MGIVKHKRVDNACGKVVRQHFPVFGDRRYDAVPYCSLQYAVAARAEKERMRTVPHDGIDGVYLPFVLRIEKGHGAQTAAVIIGESLSVGAYPHLAVLRIGCEGEHGVVCASCANVEMSCHHRVRATRILLYDIQSFAFCAYKQLIAVPYDGTHGEPGLAYRKRPYVVVVTVMAENALPVGACPHYALRAGEECVYGGVCLTVRVSVRTERVHAVVRTHKCEFRQPA